jgi:hypothetical protein
LYDVLYNAAFVAAAALAAVVLPDDGYSRVVLAALTLLNLATAAIYGGPVATGRPRRNQQLSAGAGSLEYTMPSSGLRRPQVIRDCRAPATTILMPLLLRVATAGGRPLVAPGNAVVGGPSSQASG